jgi:hypothetical protein
MTDHNFADAGDVDRTLLLSFVALLLIGAGLGLMVLG